MAPMPHFHYAWYNTLCKFGNRIWSKKKMARRTSETEIKIGETDATGGIMGDPEITSGDDDRGADAPGPNAEASAGDVSDQTSGDNPDAGQLPSNGPTFVDNTDPRLDATYAAALAEQAESVNVETIPGGEYVLPNGQRVNADGQPLE